MCHSHSTAYGRSWQSVRITPNIVLMLISSVRMLSTILVIIFYVTAMRCRWFLDILTIAIDTIIFAQPLGPIVFRWFFQFQNRCLGMIFCGKPQNNVFYERLKIATNFAYISARGVKKTSKQRGNNALGG